MGQVISHIVGDLEGAIPSLLVKNVYLPSLGHRLDLTLISTNIGIGCIIFMCIRY